MKYTDKFLSLVIKANPSLSRDFSPLSIIFLFFFPRIALARAKVTNPKLGSYLLRYSQDISRESDLSLKKLCLLGHGKHFAVFIPTRRTILNISVHGRKWGRINRNTMTFYHARFTGLGNNNDSFTD